MPTLQTINIDTPTPMTTTSTLVAPLPYTQVKDDSIHSLNIDDVTEGSCFTENFKQLLTKSDNANLQHLFLTAGTVPKNYDTLANELLALVKEKKLSFVLSLPESYRNTKIQQEIDQLTSNFQRQKNIAAFQKASSDHPSTNNTSTILTTKRTRPRTSAVSLNIDIDLESEQTQTKQTETTREMTLDSQLSNQAAMDCQRISSPKLLKKEEFIQLSHEKYFLSKQEVENIWDSLFNYQTNWKRVHWAPGTITFEAAQQILCHWRQFQSGIGPNHLVSGFNLNSIGVLYNDLPPDLSSFNGCIKVLDYDSTSINSIQKDPGIHCYPPTKSQALAHQLRQIYIQHTQIKGNQRNITLELWNKLNAEGKPYDRETFSLFSQHLTVLTSWPSDTTTFNKLFFKADEFQKKGFDFLFSNFKRIAELFPDKASLTNSDKQALKKSLQEFFPEELTTQAIDLCKSYVIELQKSPKTLEKHILHVLLKKDTENTELLAQLSYWHSQLSLCNANLNALVQVYQTHGSPGLKKLFALWQQWHAIKITTPSAKEKTLLKILQEICFINFQSYAPLLNPSYASAIESIRGFYLEKNQGNYWETLLTQHYAAVLEDDLPSLVNAFKAFTLQLQDLGLTFNRFPCQLKNIKSLPVTLAWILALLKNCRPEDRSRQWDCHDQLSFTHNGVIQALYENSLFVVPEMQTHASSNMPSYVGDTKHYLEPSINPIGQKNSELLRRDFFRFIASQNHTLSLEFYQQAEQAITSKKFSDELRHNLYRCLAATTTGSTNSLFITDTDAALAEWKKLLETIPNIIEQILKRMPFIVRGLIPRSKFELGMSKAITACLNKEGSFPLPIFLKVMESALSALSAKNNDLTKIQDLFDKVENILYQLRQCVDHCGDAVYRGMRFYDDEYYKNAADDTFLFQYHKVLIAIVNKLDIDLIFALIPLISTFQLESKDIDQIIKLIKEIQQEQQASKGSDSVVYLHFLDQYLIKNKVTDKNEEKKLTCTDLIDFLNSYKGNVDEVFSSIKSKFNKYLDVNGLAALEKKVFSNQLKENIKTQFPETKEQDIITRFLTILTDDAATPTPEKHFQIISALYKTLEKKEQNDFLNSLQQLTKITTSNESSNLADLLVKVYEKQGIRDFIYFIQKDQKKNAENNDNLVQRVRYYLEISHTDSTSNNKQLLVLLERLLLFPEEKTDLTVLRTLISQLDTLLGYDSGYATALFEFSNNFINQLENTQKPIIAIIAQFTDNLYQLAIGASASLELKSTLANLLYYSKKTPCKLDKWLDAINQQVSNPAYKTILLNILSILLSQTLEFDENHFSTLITLLQEQETPENFFTTLQKSYQDPPYPPLATLLQWWDEAKQTNNSELLPQRYKEFIVTPYPREALNGFHIEFAKKQKELFKGVFFSEEELLQLASEVNSARSRAPKEILHNLNDIKNKSQTTEKLNFQDLVKLVASLTELLYRSKGIEINTTQYLAIMAMLGSNGHVSSEIATGEGKSRIMMILAASQAFLGKTCDFVTSNMQLAQRDYIEYLPFFNMLGITTQLISADSPPTNYQQNAIHFTDMTNLSLFRNKAQTHQQLDKVIDPNKNQRSLLLDEADRSYFDLAQTRFNYSGSASKDIQGMEWIYPLLMKFIVLPEHEDSFYDDIQTHTENFISFAKAKITVEESQRLDSLANSQLETWLESAMKAKKLKSNQHFIIKPDVDIPPPQGPQIASMAYVLHDNRLCEESQYSEGVHQCLHALLEMQRRHEVAADPALAEALTQCKTPFYSSPEKRIICSTNSYDLLAHYQDGNLLGVTGTLGCQLERQEAALLYKKQGLANMAFIEVPRHQPLRRLDKPCRLAANPKRQVALLMEYIQKAYAKNQAVLLISENESKSIQLHQAIAALNQNLPETQRLPAENFQRVSSELSSEQERQLINQAGQAGMITFSTSMLGRGTDIVLKDHAKEAGLLVLLSYLPDERDYQQILGRSGRYGAAGESRIVISKEDINSNYYFNSDAWQQKEWRKRTWKTQFQRLTEFLLGDTYANYQKKFSFDNSILDKWFNFVQKVHELYKKARDKIIDLYKTKPAWNDFVTKLKTELGLYQGNMNTHYASDVTSEANGTAEPLEHKEKEESIFKILESLKAKSFPKYQTSKQAPIYNEYHQELDGRSKIYNKLFMETRAFFTGKRLFLANLRAALRGEGILFADTRAGFAGERPWFANTREFLKRSKSAFFSFKPTPTSYATNSPPAPDIENVGCNVRPT